jgi:hypothetical protein
LDTKICQLKNTFEEIYPHPDYTIVSLKGEYISSGKGCYSVTAVYPALRYTIVLSKSRIEKSRNMLDYIFISCRIGIYEQS